MFNRPDTTRKVFEAIRQAKPKQLFVAADGPRAGSESDLENCRQVRRIFSDIDWPCDFKTLFRENNAGCKNSVSSGINWFFENVDEGIILEDDCLPSRSFFCFCRELLQKYRHCKEIMHIGGFNHFFNISGNRSGYHFTKYTPIWGWATWKRAWKMYDVQLRSFPEVKQTGRITAMFSLRSEQKFRLNLFQKLYDGLIDTWDYQWNYAIRLNNGICIRPNTSLIENIGFRENATHTTRGNRLLEKVTAVEIDFPLVHPETVAIDETLDQQHYFTFIKPPLLTELINKFKNILKQ